MSDIKKMDDFFKQSFDGYEPAVPPHIWENIAAQRKKRRPVAWWADKRNGLLLAGLLIVLSGGAVMLFTQQQATNNIAHENNNNSKPGTKTMVPAAVVNNNNTNEEQAGNSSNATSTELAIATNTAPQNQDAPLNNDVTAAATASVKNNTAILPTGNYKAADTKATHSKQRKRKAPLLVTNSTGADTGDTANDNADTDAAGDATTSDDVPLWLIPVSRDMARLNLVKDWEKTKTELKAIPGPGCPKAERDAAGNKYYFEVYAGPDYVFKKYSDTGTSLISKRKESLSFHSAYSAGLRYTRVFGNGISLRAGFNYSQVNEKFSYVKDNVVQIVYVINTNGDTTDSYYVRGTRYNTSYNRYRTIDLPITLGYEMGNGRFHANINTGVVINLYSWQSGETLDNNFNPVSITTGKDNNPYQYKTNVGVGFIGAASLYYKLNDHLHLMAEPYLRYNFSPMNKEAVTLQEKFTTIGLRLGIRMDIH